MTKISGPSLERCGTIASAIDEELRKDNPSDRKNLFIRTARPRQLKNELAAYKTQIRSDWKAQFWMIVHHQHATHGPCVEISFSLTPHRATGFEIVRQDEAAIEIFHQEIGIIGPNSFTVTAVQELDDAAAANFILIEGPSHMKLALSHLNKATLEWISDPQNNEQTPLINLMVKRGYTIERRGAYLWIYMGSE